MNELDSAMESQDNVLFNGILNIPIKLIFANFIPFCRSKNAQTAQKVPFGRGRDT